MNCGRCIWHIEVLTSVVGQEKLIGVLLDIVLQYWKVRPLDLCFGLLRWQV
jgi:hypothetical protein